MLQITTIPATPKSYEINEIINPSINESLDTGEDKNLTFIFDQNNNVLSFSLKDGNDILYRFNLDFDIIKSSASFSDQTLWAIKTNALKIRSLYNEDSVYDLNISDLIELTNTTLVSKTPYFSNFPLESRSKDPNNFNSTPFRIFVPSKNSQLSDCKIIVNRPIPYADEIQGNTFVTIQGDVTVTNVGEDLGLTGEQAKQVVLDTGLPLWDWKTLISGITLTPNISNPEAGDDITITVQTQDLSVSSVYVESVNGVANKSIVRLNNGQGSFIIKTDMLESGDDVLIKVGYKYFSNKSSYSVTLS